MRSILVPFCSVVAIATAAPVATAQTPPIVRASVANDGAEANGFSYTRNAVAISRDGRYVAFVSDASNLVAGDTNGQRDAFVRDVVAGTTVRVSVGANGEQNDWPYLEAPAISGDGRFVAFSTQSPLVADDSNGIQDVYLHDRDPDENGIFDEGNGTLERVSIASDGTEGDNSSYYASISDDGDVIAFRSFAKNLINKDLNDLADIFVRVRSTTTTLRVSVGPNGGANGDNDHPQLSADGSSVVFMSRATNLGVDGGPDWDIFVHDLATRTNRLASCDASGIAANRSSDSPSISADGRFVTFRSEANNLFPEIGSSEHDIFVKDMLTGSVDCATVGADGLAGNAGVMSAISADGSHVVFSGSAIDYFPIDTNGGFDILVRDLATRSIVCANIDCTGIPASDGAEYLVSISGDGRYAVFISKSDQIVEGDEAGFLDVFVHDLANPGPQASWSNYGAGWPGTLGEPAFTASADPEFGATIDLLAANSWGPFNVGFVLLGFAEDALVTSLGGTILVDFDFLTPVIVPPTGWRESVTIPYDTALCEVDAFLQILEIDPGATRGVSFSPGLKLTIGR